MHDNLAIHYGVAPIHGAAFQGDPAAVDGFDRTDVEHGFHVLGHSAWVSGSWQTWGIDPDIEHDGSLHIVVFLDTYAVDHVEVDRITEAVRALVTRGRLMDYAVVSRQDDWSVQTHHVSTGPGQTYVTRLA